MSRAEPDLRWRLGHGVELAFSTMSQGDMREPQLRAAWLRELGVGETAVVTRQVHSARVVMARPGPAADADGLVGARPTPPLVVFGADCPGLCVASPDAIGLAHCGWRGVAGGMVTALIDAVRQHTTHPPATWQAFIGPAVHPDAYEVDEPVLSARLWPDGAHRPSRPGRAFLDLPAAIASDLAHHGVHQVQRAAVTTSRDPRLWSYRARGEGIVQGLAAWWSAP